MKKARIAVLVSGGGTNLQALIDAQHSGVIHNGEIALVISNNASAYALERAAKAHIESAVVLKKECGSQAAFEERIKALLTENKIDLIVLAGFMSILSESFTGDYPKRILNQSQRDQQSIRAQYHEIANLSLQFLPHCGASIAKRAYR